MQTERRKPIITAARVRVVTRVRWAVSAGNGPLTSVTALGNSCRVHYWVRSFRVTGELATRFNLLSQLFPEWLRKTTKISDWNHQSDVPTNRPGVFCGSFSSLIKSQTIYFRLCSLLFMITLLESATVPNLLWTQCKGSPRLTLKSMCSFRMPVNHFTTGFISRQTWITTVKLSN